MTHKFNPFGCRVCTAYTLVVVALVICIAVFVVMI